MGVLAGSISYTRYEVVGDLPGDYRDRYLDCIRDFAFEPLRPEAEDDTSTGWVVCGELLDTEFTRDKVWLDTAWAALSLRHDRWSLPAALVRAVVAERCNEHARARDREKLTRAENEEIREQIVREMKRNALPAAAMTDLLWNLDTGCVRFWSHSNKANERFVALFEETFELKLIPRVPWVAAQNCGLSAKAIGELSELHQAEFTGGR